jgi:hypothetical protein
MFNDNVQNLGKNAQNLGKMPKKTRIRVNFKRFIRRNKIIF